MTRKPGAFFSTCPCCPTDMRLSVGLLERRGFIKGSIASVAGAAAASVGPRMVAEAQPEPRRIDVHHHLTPPAFIAAMRRRNLHNPSAFAWTPQRSLDEMNRAGVAVALLSVARPELAFFEDRDEA